jgi:phosphate/sulfate permease
MEILILAVVFSVLIGFWANAWGRDAIIWFVISAIISPLLSGIILLIIGKTIEKKAEEQRALRELLGD